MTTILNKLRYSLRKMPSTAACLVLLLVAAGVFGNSLRNGFVWDDIFYIVNNPAYRSFDITRIFTTLGNGLEYFPVRDLSYAIDFTIGSGSQTVFHASSVLIYALTVLCVFGYARLAYRFIHPAESEERDRRSLAAGFFTALLFAVHPIHSEVVNFITCRNALLSTFFFFVSAILFLTFLGSASGQKMRMTAYAAALVFFLLSVFSKANSIILPLILLLHVPYVPKERRTGAALSSLPFVAAAGASFFLFTTIAVKSHIITDRMEEWTLNGSITKLVKALQIVLFYLGKLVYPTGLSAAYDTVFAWSPATPSVVATFACIAAALVAAFHFRSRAPYLFFGLCWYLAALLPVLNFFSTSPAVSDRYAFLPSFAFFFIVAAAGVQLSAKVRPVWLTAAGIIIAAVWGGLAVSRNRVWFSEETLWRDTIRTAPNNTVGYRNLGSIYLKREEYGTALDILSAIADTDPIYYHTIGFVALNRGNLQDAIENFKKALARNPQYIGSLYYMGVTYERMGQPVLAAGLFRNVLQSADPDVNLLKEKAQERLKSY